ncbi:hypothetical protein Hanom_Chr05g00394831 [Helianthus anomalus]
MKRIWDMWHVMVEQFADVACYGERFRWKTISMFHSLFWMRDPPRYRIEDLDTNTDNDDDSDPNYVESMDDESNDVSSLFDDSDSDVISTDGMSDEDDEQDRDSTDYHKVDPDYRPIEFVWKFDRRFRLIVDVALASRIDMTMKTCVQNLSGAEKMVVVFVIMLQNGARNYKTKWYKSSRQVRLCLLCSSKQVDLKKVLK